MSTNNSSIIGHIICSLITISGLFFSYEIIANSDWTFAPEWNMFKSLLLVPLYIIGIIVMFANWSKFSFSQDTYVKTTYSDGSTKTEKSYDITDVIFGRFLLPLIGRFVIVPLLVSAAIYYPLMCVVWLVGSIFPYVLALLILVIITISWMYKNIFEFKNREIILAITGLLFIAGFTYGGYSLEQNATPYEPQEAISGGEDSGFEDVEINEDEFE